MPARIIARTVFFSMLIFTGVLIYTSADPSAMLRAQAVKTNSLKAKEVLLGLEVLPTTSNQTMFEGKTVMEVIKIAYLDRDSREIAIDTAERDIYHYLGEMLKLNRWRVYTSDHAIDVSSENFNRSRIIGSAKTEVAGGVYIICQVG